MKMLVIEDSPEIIQSVSLCFELMSPGGTFVFAIEGKKGVALVETESPDVVILDINLPDINGFEALEEIRRFSDVPVIMLTVRGDEMDKVRGLETGADDYIVKPFSPTDLMARVRAVLRRAKASQVGSTSSSVLNFGDLSINPTTREVFLGTELVKLTPTEYKLLYYLARNEGRVLSHRTLLEKVWGSEYSDAPYHLKKYIQRLRLKLKDDPLNPRLIFTEWGVGYRFVSPD